MPWTPPTFTPVIAWDDAPDRRTPLDASNLNQVEAAGASYATSVGQSIVDYFAVGGGSVVANTVLSPGNLGTAYTVDFAHRSSSLITLSGTLNANVTITFVNLAVGCHAILLLLQDGTGSHTVTVSDGSHTQMLIVSPTAGTISTFEVDCPNGTDLYVSPFVSLSAGAALTPQQFGAKADGTTDDTAAIQAAINSLPASGGTIYFPPGTYKFNGIQFRNKKGLNIRGAGLSATILKIAANNAIGLDFFGSAGTGDTADIHISDLQVNFTGTGTTAVRFWNVEGFSVKRCYFASDVLAMSVQGSFVGTVEDSQIYVFGSNANAISALWIGSGKSAPHTGSTTLSGVGNLKFGGTAIQSQNSPAVIIEENNATTKFETCILEANHVNSTAFNGMVEIDAAVASVGSGVAFDRCYQEGSGFGGADFALGSHSGHCNRVTIRGYESTGSVGMNYAIDVTACDHLWVEQIQCTNYTLGVMHFRTGYLTGLATNTKADLHCEQIDNGGVTAPPAIYVDDDSNVASTYRGAIVRSNVWRHLLTRVARLDAAVVTGAGTYCFAQSNPTASGTGDPNEGLAFFYIDPADFGYAALRVRMSVIVNATAPGTNFTGGMVVSSGNPAGGAASVTQANGSFTTSPGAVVNTPAANSKTAAVSNVGYVTSAGWYALAVSPAGAFTASSAVAVSLRLEALN